MPLFDEFERRGFAVVAGVVDAAHCDAFTAAVAARPTAGAGSGTLLDDVWCRALAVRLRTHPLLTAVVPTGYVAVRCTLFDKSPKNNWRVPLHKDVSVAVRERVSVSALSGWSIKERVVFVQPPLAVLESLIAARLHLDEAVADVGLLQVVAGSHRFGRLTAERATQLRKQRRATVIDVPRGGVLLMRPLLLHASSKAIAQAPRRVLHFVFGPPSLPAGLRWHDAV